MSDLLFWLYLTNAVLLINHEIDSAAQMIVIIYGLNA